MIMLSVPSRVGIAPAMTLLPMNANVAGPADDEYTVWPVNPSLRRRYKTSQPLLQSLLVALISSGSGPITDIQRWHEKDRSAIEVLWL